MIESKSQTNPLFRDDKLNQIVKVMIRLPLGAIKITQWTLVALVNMFVDQSKVSSFNNCDSKGFHIDNYSNSQ